LNGDEVVKAVREVLGSSLLEGVTVKPNRVNMVVDKGAHRRAIEALKSKFGEVHLFSIVGADLKDRLELTYNLWLYEAKIHVMLKTSLPLDGLEIETITDLIPGSTLYEREVYEMLGVLFKGHPNLKRLFLPEDWPEGLWPLRKNAKLEEVA